MSHVRIHRPIPACSRTGCPNDARADSTFCSALCEHQHFRAIERTTPREVVETGELLSGRAYLDGGTRRANLQNSA
jgi:hypothetical protein